MSRIVPKLNYQLDSESRHLEIGPNGVTMESMSTDRHLLDATRESLDSIARSLSGAHDAREYLIRNTRDVIILCSRSIAAVHRGDMDSAIAKADEAKRLLMSHRKKAGSDLVGHLAVAEQELVEAMALIAIASHRPVPSAAELGTPGGAYVLGLLDCIGELKRLALDRIRAGDAGEANRVFGIMQELYEAVYPFATLDKVVKDVRRKLDVNRSLIESVRAAVTEEARRAELIKALGEASKGGRG